MNRLPPRANGFVHALMPALVAESVILAIFLIIKACGG
jgi:hypothetical protein